MEKKNKPVPPAALQIERFVRIHGDRRGDPFFWLRERENPNVRLYLEAENAYTNAVMQPTEGAQEMLYREMLARIKQTDVQVPYRLREYWYYSRTEEGRQYPLWARRQGSMEAEEEILLDLNRMAEGHKFMDLGAFAVSDNACLLAYTTDNVGFRQYSLYVKEPRTGKILGLIAERVGSVAWAADDRTLFYTQEDAQTKRQYRLYRHNLATSESTLVREETDELFSLEVYRTRSRAFLMLDIRSHTTSETHFLPADRPEGEWRVIEPRRQDVEYDADHHGERLYLRINDTARTFRLVSMPADAVGKENWKEELPARSEVMLENVAFFTAHQVRTERIRGLAQMIVVEMACGKETTITFPEPAYDAGPAVNMEFETHAFRYHYVSLITPPSIYEFDMQTHGTVLLKQEEVLGGYEPGQYQTERLWAKAADGVEVPVSVVFRRNTPLDSSAPLFLQGYGSYGYPLPVTFRSSRLSLLDRGVIVALAHVRGGGEMGKVWHDDGRLQKKENSFTDFIAVAECLIAGKYTSAGNIIASGGSAGGLLMGAVANLRPDLWKAILSHVPFVDVLNTMLDASLPLTIGEYEEWGNPNLAEDYRVMRRYCPYSNLEAKNYPAMLIRTSFHDSQVMYWEPAKYVARLRTLKTDDHRLLLKTDMDAGHGGASGRYDALRETAYDYAFLLDQWGLLPEVPAG